MQEMSKRQNQDLRADSAWRINTGKIESTFDCVTFVETNYLTHLATIVTAVKHTSESYRNLLAQEN